MATSSAGSEDRVPDSGPGTGPPVDPPSTRQEELRSFFFFTVVMAPVLAVTIVAGYGFIVWMYQLIAGPPGS